MDLIGSHQVDNEILESTIFDLFIVSSGFERRCIWLESNYNIQAEQKVAISAGKKHFDIFKSGNNKAFKEKGFTFLDLAPAEDLELINFVEKYLSKNRNRELNILIDYSGMTKEWYFGLLNLFSQLENEQRVFHIFFSYTPVKYIKKKKSKAIKIAKSISHDSKPRNSEKPTVLILGLGLEPGKSDYLKELLKPDKTVLLYADPAPKDYVDLIFENNKKVISEVEMRNMINYPIDDLNSTIEILTNLILDLRLQSNIILAPLGSKDFALISMLINLHYPDVDIWRISSNMLPSENKQQALLSPVILKLTFSSTDED